MVYSLDFICGDLKKIKPKMPPDDPLLEHPPRVALRDGMEHVRTFIRTVLTQERHYRNTGGDKEKILDNAAMLFRGDIKVLEEGIQKNRIALHTMRTMLRVVEDCEDDPPEMPMLLENGRHHRGGHHPTVS